MTGLLAGTNNMRGLDLRTVSVDAALDPQSPGRPVKPLLRVFGREGDVSRIVVTDLAAAAQKGKGAPEITYENWVRLLRGEYLEIPGLLLTRDQIQQLWALDDVTCDAVIEALVDRNFLRQSSAGAYVRADDWRP